MGGDGGIVEVDETFYGTKTGKKMRPGTAHKMVVLSLIERSTGQVRSFHIDKANANEIDPIVQANIARETTIATDEARYYSKFGEYVDRHETVMHKNDEWARGDIYTNNCESYFSVFKRGMRGTYQHCAEKHLHRYVSEFDFRYNNRAKLGIDDEQRTAELVKGVVGKRLTYRTPHSRADRQGTD